VTADDADLVLAARGGDVRAFEALVRRHVATAYVVALGAIGEPADAEDAVQDALIQCYGRLHECRSPARFRAWFLRIVRNRAHNYREYLAVRRWEPIGESAGHAGEGPAARLERTELRRELLSAINQEPEIRRQVLLLHDLSGMPHAEVATTLGISVLMSRHHLSVARRAVRKRLRSAGYSGGEELDAEP
jgi:RNA polymerase sigma-70 factor (ECF subfamily)